MAFTKLLGGLNQYTGGIFGSKASRKQPTMTVDEQLIASPVELDISETAHMKNRQFTFSTVSYPENPDINMEGHYMLFHILTSTMSSGSRYDRLSQIDRDGDVFVTDDVTEAQKNNADGIRAHEDKINKLRQPGINRKKFERTSHMISLYMPPSITIDHKTNYKNEAPGLFSRVISAAKGQGLLGGIANGATEGGLDVFNTVKATADRLGQNAEQLESGTVNLDRQEVLFEGIDFRTFSFEYNFIPQSETELKNVYDICQLFRYHSRPKINTELSAKGQYDFTLPSRFLIQFMYRTQENTFLNKIGTVVCSNVSITYGDGDVWKSFRPIAGAHFSGTAPVRTNLKLEFTEIDLIDKTAIDLGF